MALGSYFLAILSEQQNIQMKFLLHTVPKFSNRVYYGLFQCTFISLYGIKYEQVNNILLTRLQKMLELSLCYMFVN